MQLQSRTLIAAALILNYLPPALAEAEKPARSESIMVSKAGPELSVLKGNWGRPDGGYTVVIRAVGPDGQLDAMYFNPNQLPFSKAQVQRGGTGLRVSLELRAGGYSGSTYDLSYEAASDTLKGTYYQAVAKQSYDVFFVRKYP